LAEAALAQQRLESVLQEPVGQIPYFPQLHLMAAAVELANQQRLLVMLARLGDPVAEVLQIASQEPVRDPVGREIRLQHHLLKAIQEVLPAILVEPDLELVVVAVLVLQGQLVPAQEMAEQGQSGLQVLVFITQAEEAGAVHQPPQQVRGQMVVVTVEIMLRAMLEVQIPEGVAVAVVAQPHITTAAQAALAL